MKYLQAKLGGELSLPPIRPYARGFDGTIELNKEGNSYTTRGRATKKTRKSVLVDELPLRCWTNSYKEKLLKMRSQGTISSFVENHTTARVSFLISMNPSKLARMEKTGFETGLKLRSMLSLSNMHAFDETGVIRRYNQPEDIVEAYFPIRLSLYEDRKSVLESEATYAAALYRNKAKFIEHVTQGKIDLISGTKTRAAMTKELHNEGFATHADLISLRNNNSVFRRMTGRSGEHAVDVPEDDFEEHDTTGYDYLLNMPLSSLSAEKIASLVQDAAGKDKELAAAKSTSATDLWSADLDKLVPFLE